MLNGPFSGWPSYTKEEINAVSQVLSTNKVNYWTGDECKFFEQEFAMFTGCEYAIALANGTVALDLALKAVGIGSGDEVIVTSRTFIASVSSIINSGATPIFADVDPLSQNIHPQHIKSAISKKTKAILCVHLAGWPCEMDPILEIAKTIDAFVIEDCAQAHGASYKGKRVGSIGHIGCWSFCQDKILTTGGEGGMVTTNSRALWAKMWSYKDHGKDWDLVFEENKSTGFNWIHSTFGTNWRMTEVQAAIGRIQLKKLPDWHKLRNNNAKRIWQAANETSQLMAPKFRCSDCVGRCTEEKFCEHAFYKCYVFVQGSSILRDEIMAKINAENVPCFSGSCSEVYLEKAFHNSGFQPEIRLPNAKRLGEISLMFLCHPTLSDAEIQKTCDVIKDICK